jgi:hypothetical protein
MEKEMEKETGGPAFPANDSDGYWAEGMTLRDYFAARALRLYSDDTLERMAQNAKKVHQQADAMLKAREQ